MTSADHARQLHAARKDNPIGSAAMPFSVYPCTPHRINPACFHPADRAPGFAGCCHQCDSDGIVVEGGFGLAMVIAMVRATVTVLVGEADLRRCCSARSWRSSKKC